MYKCNQYVMIKNILRYNLLNESITTWLFSETNTPFKTNSFHLSPNHRTNETLH